MDYSMLKVRIRDFLIYSTFFVVTFIILATVFFYYCIRMPGESFSGSLPGMDASMQNLSKRLDEHVRILAEEIGERNFHNRDALEKAADYIEEQFNSIHYVPKNQMVNNGDFRNIVVDHYGSQRRDRIIIVGAHYDTTWGTPGADDNASGIAALIEIARELKEKKFPVTIRFVAFVNEERPFFGRDDMGSGYHARHAREQNEDIIGMFSLEMLGYYSDQPRSQWYPRRLRKHYPQTADFVAFVSNLVSRKFLIDSLTAFRTQARFPSEGLTAPQWLVPSIRRSDHASFWANGYPAVMVTDTAEFRNFNYHLSTDRHETLDYERLARVVSGLTKMLEELADQY